LFAIKQADCGDSDNRKARKSFETAQSLLRAGKIQDAYRSFNEAINEDPDYAKAYLEMAYISFRLSESAETRGQVQQMERHYNNAVNQYKKAAEICPSLNNYDICFWLGKYFYSKRDFQESIKYINLFLNNTNKHQGIKHAQIIKRKIDKYYELINNPVPYNPVPVQGINSNEDEYLPLISPDGEMFFFTHRYAKKVKENVDFRWVDEFRVSRFGGKKQNRDLFTSGEPMPSPFNMGVDQGGVSITIDNNVLYVTLCEMTRTSQGPYKNCDIWVSEYSYGEWTPLRNLGPNINGRTSWESQPSISADGKTLFFSTIRPDNIGFDIETNQTSDIWYSTKDENGIFQKAKNLGNVINTSGNEKSPFIHSDSQTLYFSSDGHDGVGGYDIFYSRMKADGTWEEPKNIGYPINTEADELGLIVSTNGQKAYFSSNQLNDNGSYDIFEFELYKEARPEEVIFVKGQLVDDTGKDLADATIEVKSVETQRVVEGMVDKMTGRYAVVIPVKKPDEEFLMTVKKRDYAFTSHYITPKEVETEKPLKVDFEVKPIEVNKTVQLNNIYFSTNSAQLYKTSLFVLDNFLEFLNENPNIKIEIHGHTDNIGNPAANQLLSENRAKAVRDYLLIMGLNSNRIADCKGFGQNKPIASNNTEEGRAKNRRTEFVIVGK